MSGPGSRRGFLRDLVALPLIGGGLTLVGAPLAVAEAPSPRLLLEYANWLAYERYRAEMEAHGTNDHHWYRRYGAAYEWHQLRAKDGPIAAPPSTRAALVLSAVGCDWQEARA